MSKIAPFILVLVAVLSVSIWYFQPRPLIRWLADLDRDVVYSYETDQKVVALTIDDGPHPKITPQILEVLEENDSHATFFVLGRKVKGKEVILSDIRKGKHEIANHLLADYPSIFLQADQFEKQLLDVQVSAGIDTTKSKWFRPGFGWYNQPMKKKLEENGYRLALASVYPRDTVVRSVKLIERYILRRVEPGDIIVLHDGKDDRVRTVEVLRTVLPELKKRGYEIVTLSELDRLANEHQQTTPQP